MATLREQIVAAIVVALNTGTPGGVPAAERTRRIAVQEGASLNSIVVRPTKQSSEPVHRPGSPVPPLTKAILTVEVEMLKAGTAADRPDKLIDPLYEWVVKTLVGNTLAGLCHGIEEGESAFEYAEDGEYPNVMLTTEMVVPFSYKATDPASKT